MDWRVYWHTTLTCRENCKVTISQATRWCLWDFLILQLSYLLGAWLQAITRPGSVQDNTVHTASITLSSAAGLSCSLLVKSWNPNQGKFSPQLFDIRIALRISMVNTVLNAWGSRKWRVGVNAHHQKASGTIHGFHFCFLFQEEPI